MKGIGMYSKIQQMKEDGLKQAQAARLLRIHRKTVKRYWDMSIEEYGKYRKQIKRISALDEYKDTIVGWLKKYPCMSSAQVCDWLKENYNKGFSERTVSRYVNGLRKEYDIPKTAEPREYTAVEEPPPGKQCQVDFGEKTIRDAAGKPIKVRVAVFVLSHSRYKFGYAQSRPFHTVDLIAASRLAFEYFGGMTDEIVYDQDSIICVSENHGDLILTEEFEKFRQECGFKVFMCHPADPETKGKVENAVKFVKGNFLVNRTYPGSDKEINEQLLAWLRRTGNEKVHSTTRRKPTDVFDEEKPHLKPYVKSAYTSEVSREMRTVRKDNTILFKCNRYSVPVGTYNTLREVCIEATDDGYLRIFRSDGEFICEHLISPDTGKLIKNRSHDRDTSESLNHLQETVNAALDGKAADFLRTIRNEKSRYARDQFNHIKKLIDEYGKEKVIDAIELCVKVRMVSSVTVEEYLKHIEKCSEQESQVKVRPLAEPKLPDKAEYHPIVQKRSPSEYARLGGGTV